jgi:hypothetical protein
MAEPLIGLFWALPSSEGAWDVVAFALPFGEVPDIGGFRTLDDGHVDLWPTAAPEPNAGYEDFPRGRVNWREADRRFLLLLDPLLRRRIWINRIVCRFRLPAAETLVMTDSHYRSTRTPPTAPSTALLPEAQCASR